MPNCSLKQASCMESLYPWERTVAHTVECLMLHSAVSGKGAVFVSPSPRKFMAILLASIYGSNFFLPRTAKVKIEYSH